MKTLQAVFCLIVVAVLLMLAYAHRGDTYNNPAHSNHVTGR